MDSTLAMFKSYLAIFGVLLVALLDGCATSSHTEDGYTTEREQKVELEQIVTVSSPVKNVPIIVSYQGGVIYHVQVNNALPTEISLIWDESTYVTTTGDSIRLLHLQGKSELPQQPPAQQVSSLIPPRSEFQADFTGDDWLDCARRNCKPQPKNSVKKARIYLTFKIKGKWVRWQGEVLFVPRKPR